MISALFLRASISCVISLLFGCRRFSRFSSQCLTIGRRGVNGRHSCTIVRVPMSEEAFVALRARACGMELARSIMVEWATFALFALAFEIERT